MSTETFKQLKTQPGQHVSLIKFGDVEYAGMLYINPADRVATGQSNSMNANYGGQNGVQVSIYPMGEQGSAFADIDKVKLTQAIMGLKGEGSTLTAERFVSDEEGQMISAGQDTLNNVTFTKGSVNLDANGAPTSFSVTYSTGTSQDAKQHVEELVPSVAGYAVY